MPRKSETSRFDSTVLDPQQELELAAAFARSEDTEGAWTASQRAQDAAERIHDPSLRADAELAAQRFEAQEHAFRASVERRMKEHEANELKFARADLVAAEADRTPPRPPGLLARIVDAIRGAFSAPARVR